MKPRPRSTVIVICVLCVIALLAGFLSDREPRYEGKSLSRWLDDINDAGSLSNAEPALLAIRAMGTNALPLLFANIGHQDSAMKRKAIDVIEKANIDAIRYPFRRGLKSPACLALKTLGTNASSIVSDLGALALIPEKSSWAITALFSIGESAVPGLVHACESTDFKIRTSAAVYLCKVSDGSQRGWSWGWNKKPSGRMMFGVGSAYGGEEDAVALARQLKHTNAGVRRASAEALMVHSRAAKVVLENLKSAQNDEEESVRNAVASAITAIQKDAIDAQ